MERCLNRRAWVAGFEKPKTSPNSLEPSTTVLSPYLKFGCLSPRLFYHRVQEIYDAFPKHASPPVSLHGQLLWREFFYLCGYTVPNFGKMEGNPICKQVPWAEGPEAEARLAAWAGARTGYPWIDAAMTQLRQEGWLHHLARHAVACFLTRGDLWVSWERGAAVFDRLLLDADWSLNSANWMWLSCSSFFYQYFRCYSPVAFGKKTDPDGEYIKKYLPQLRNFPKKYIYEPWLAPKSMQESCGCVIGVDYPEPIVDHSIISKENMAKMKQAYANQPGSAEGGSASLPLSGRGAITGEAAAAGESRSGAKKRPGKKTTAKEEQKMDSASSGTAGKKKVKGGPAIAGTSKKKQKTLLEGGFGKQHGMDGDGK
uniref:Cryptochrome/DNA photolyase FAD-binding domain-containing protein n=1 Tax=Heterosigma akashiwo TaxID=2829 RepID=A0A6S9LDJ6_HETAK